MKATLVSALSACACERQRKKARQFLQGLSADELQFIAEFFGAWILEGSAAAALAGSGGTEACDCGVRHGAAPGGLDDREHKIILVREYLSRCGLDRAPAAVRVSGHAS